VQHGGHGKAISRACIACFLSKTGVGTCSKNRLKKSKTLTFQWIIKVGTGAAVTKKSRKKVIFCYFMRHFCGGF
jgi:hypothetical protein